MRCAAVLHVVLVILAFGVSVHGDGAHDKYV